ncbi:MAG: hypothetical protein MUC85_05585 [Anaerolineales bacterium]|jgi:hypothetical protein|nr:hypothetical protein [Anaerolineales bacterium]
MSESKKQLDLSLRGILKWLIEQITSNLLIGIIIILILAVVTYFLSPLNFPLTLLSKPVDVVVYQECYHIGDVTRDWFCHPSPQTNPFERSFQIERLSGTAYVRLTAKHVDPDEIRAPVRLYLNGVFIDYINRYFQEETVNPKTVEIPLPPDILRVGDNNIIIISGTEVNEFYENVDDLEFWDLMLRFK